MKQDPTAGTITKAIGDLETHRETASQLLWDHYFERLCRYANTRIATSQKRLIDNEAVASSALYALFDGLENNRFEHIGNRDELWRILITVTARKASDQRRHFLSAKRGAGKGRGDSVFSANDFKAAIADPRGDSDPLSGLEFEAIFDELIQRLPDANYCQIARLRLAGHSNHEIAETLDCSPRTVIRKLTLIQSTLLKIVEPDDAKPK